MNKKAVCVISGGLDSATAAYIAKSQGYEIIALHFDYNQRTMNKERQCFNQICDDLGVEKRYILNADFIAQIGGNSLTDTSLKIRKTGVEKDLPNSYVPYRNGIFLSIAAALAQKEKAQAIFIGVVQDDSSGYPDCSLKFISQINLAINEGTGENMQIIAPLVDLNKGEIVQKALNLGVNLAHSWSCYESEIKPCGECDSCRLRANGFEKVNLKDPII